MKVLLAACGSRGDVQPMLSLAVALRDAGHDVILGASPPFASEARAFNIPFAPVGQDTEQLLKSQPSSKHWRSIALVYRMMREEVRLQLAQLVPLAAGADLVVGAGVALTGRTVAQLIGRPFRYVGYTPQIVPSPEHPPLVVRGPRPPRWVNRVLWWAFGKLYDVMVKRTLNQSRQDLGLEPIRSVIPHALHSPSLLIASDPELWTEGSRQPVQIGSFCLADERPLSDELLAFLAAGEPPIYVGFGSMTDDRPDETTALILEAAQRANVRVLLSAGWAALGNGACHPSMLTIGPVSHWKLFPHVSAVVHHGGAGTTAAAARAGKPQVIVPHVFDQFTNALRAKNAGVAVTLSRRKLTAVRLAQKLNEVLSNPDILERARQVGESIRQRKPLTEAVRLLEAAASIQ